MANPPPAGALANGVVMPESTEEVAPIVRLCDEHGVPMACIELLDAPALQTANLFSKTTPAETPTLYFEFHGSSAPLRSTSCACSIPRSTRTIC